jgi:RND family efflux transporter MFP subunit
MNQQADLAALARSELAGEPAERVPLPRARWKTRVLLPVAVFGATAVVLGWATGESLWPATPVRVVPVVVKVGTGEIGPGAVTVQAPGWVEADPFATAVSALADGVVEDVLVLEGEPVSTGQTVARLVPDDARLALEQAEALVMQREAEVLVADAALSAAQRDWDNPVELTRKVATAEATLRERKAELERWPAELAAAEALATYLEAEHRRVVPLYEGGLASDIELIRARQQHLEQQAVVDSTRARKPILEAQFVAAEAELRAAGDNLRLRIPERRALDEAQAAVARSQAALAEARSRRDEARLRLERMEVRSPVDGVVMVRLKAPGSKLMLGGDDPQSAQVLRVYDPRKLQVRVDVPLVDAAKVGVGQAAEVVVDVLPDRVFHGHVTRIVNEADIQKNTLQVKVAIADPSPEVKPEMLARARFLAAARPAATGVEQRVFAPEALMQRGANGQARVWVADQGRNVAVSRAVAVGRGRVNDWIEVEEGLQPGDRLIADPPMGLADGDRINIIGEAVVRGGV